MTSFKPAPIPGFELPRLKELYNLELLDTERGERFDRYIKLITTIFNMPIVTISLLDAKRQWFIATCGLPLSDADRNKSLCAYTILEKDMLIIEDTKKNPISINNVHVISEPYIRFYAGVVLRGPTGLPVGTMCIMNHKTYNLSNEEQQRLLLIGKMVEHELQYNYHLNEIKKNVETKIYYDELTGLPNKRLIKEQLLYIAKPSANQTIIVAALTIIDYEKLKEAFGQDFMAKIILHIRDKLNHLVENKNILLGYDKDHFLIIFFNQSKQSILSALISPIINIFNELFKIKNYEVKVDGAIGICIYPDDTEDIKILIEQATSTMYRSKTNKSLFEVYSQQKTEELVKIFDLTAKFTKALKHNQFQIVYQPKVDIQTGVISGAEALCRWQDENNNSISPQIFIHIAETSHQIIPLTIFILHKVCENIKRWLEMGIEVVAVSVNLPSEFLLKPDFLETIKAILNEYKIDSKYLIFEVLETSLFLDIDLAIKQMLAITQQLGIRFALDDFGTGYSSLTYMKQLPIQILKIDKAFIKNMTLSKKDAALVRAIIAFANNLDLKVIAEGVETEEQLIYLKSYNCDYVQGFLFSKPVTVKEFFRLLRDHKNVSFPILKKISRDQT